MMDVWRWIQGCAIGLGIGLRRAVDAARTIRQGAAWEFARGCASMAAVDAPARARSNGSCPESMPTGGVWLIVSPMCRTFRGGG
jgi:hypothetical protein